MSEAHIPKQLAAIMLRIAEIKIELEELPNSELLAPEGEKRPKKR
jgi:hypothetical protein